MSGPQHLDKLFGKMMNHMGGGHSPSHRPGGPAILRNSDTKYCKICLKTFEKELVQEESDGSLPVPKARVCEDCQESLDAGVIFIRSRDNRLVMIKKQPHHPEEWTDLVEIENEEMDALQKTIEDAEANTP